MPELGLCPPRSLVRKCAFDWYLPKTVFSRAHFWWLMNVQNSNLKYLGWCLQALFPILLLFFPISGTWRLRMKIIALALFPMSRVFLLRVPAKPSILMNSSLSFLVTRLGLCLWKGRRRRHPVEDRTHDESSGPLFASFSLEFFY